MERLKLAEVRTLLEFVRGLYAVRDLDGFVEYALSGLPAVVFSDLTAYGDLNPSKGSFNIISRPTKVVTPQWHRVFKAYAHEHPFTSNYMGGGNGSARRISDILPHRRFHRSALYNEFFRAIDIGSEMVVWLPAPRPREITFAVHRGKADFSNHDRLLFDLVRPHLIQAYRSAEAVSLLRQAVEAGGQGMLLFTAEGRIRHTNVRAQHLLAEYFDKPARLANRLPESLARWVRHQTAPHRAVDGPPPPREPLVLEREGRRLSVRLLTGLARSLLLFREERLSLEPTLLEPLGLSRREAEVLAWVAQGKTNDETAMVLGLSPRTVEKHMESVRHKLGVETRTAAAARAFEIAGDLAAIGEGR